MSSNQRIQPPDDLEQKFSAMSLDGEEPGIPKQKVTAILGRIYDVLPPDAARKVRAVAQSQLVTYAYQGDLDMVRLLLEVGRYANCNDAGTLSCQAPALRGKKLTPLSAAAFGRQDQVVAYLLGTGRCGTQTIESAYLHACLGGTVQTLELFLGQKINFHARGVKDKSALHYATLGGDKEKVKRLLEAGIGIELPDEEGKKAYDYPYDHDDGELYKLFFQYGPHKLDIKYIDGRKRTFLHYAAEKGKKSIATALLELGVDPDVRSKGGRTAYQIARDMTQLDLANIIRPKMSPQALQPPPQSGILATLLSWKSAPSDAQAELVSFSPAPNRQRLED